MDSTVESPTPADREVAVRITTITRSAADTSFRLLPISRPGRFSGTWSGQQCPLYSLLRDGRDRQIWLVLLSERIKVAVYLIESVWEDDRSHQVILKYLRRHRPRGCQKGLRAEEKVGPGWTGPIAYSLVGHPVSTTILHTFPRTANLQSPCGPPGLHSTRPPSGGLEWLLQTPQSGRGIAGQRGGASHVCTLPESKACAGGGA